MAASSTRDRVANVIREFTKNLGRKPPSLVSTSNLHRDLGLSSDEGVMLVLDLCDEFKTELPEDFNAVVHDDGRRGRTFEELVNQIGTFVHSEAKA